MRTHNKALHFSGLIITTWLMLSCLFGQAVADPAVDITVDITVDSAEGEVIGEGQFVGMSGHEASGGLSIERHTDHYLVRFADDFLFDGAPDPRLGFGKTKYLPSTEFAPLTHLAGAKTYRIPLSAELERYSSFWIWCEAFSVPIGRVDLR